MIKVGIVGYGNVGRGVESALKQNKDMELVSVFTRRDPSGVQASVPAVAMDDILSYKDKIDVLFLCGGSATDLPVQGPELAEHFNIVDTFDTHAKIPEYFKEVDSQSKKGGHVGIISTGWDPGLFSLLRLLGNVALPKGEDYTFWGKGVSQGHSDAIRRVSGVRRGIQYTCPIESAVAEVRKGTNPIFTTREKHKRVCYVVADSGADFKAIEDEIKSMPNYFSDYDTEVNFIDDATFDKDHQNMPHGGFVIRSGESNTGNKQRMEFQLELGSNPEFTANVMVAYGRAAYKNSERGFKGALSVFEIPFSDLSPVSIEDLRKNLL